MAAAILKKRRGVYFQLLLILVLLLPLWMSLAWFFGSKRKLVVAIVDKTVLTREGQEHISLNWILTQERFTKNNKDLYKSDHDYFGFFPGKDEKFQLKGLERFNEEQLKQLANESDLAYITDSYGIYRNEWYKQGDSKDRSGIVYGGMSKQDVFLLKQMQQKHKLIVTEFNCLGSPTDSSIRNSFENLFGIRWSGWIGRYFDSFDTLTNKEIPKWLVRNYKLQHNGAWPFTKSGIAFIHADDRIMILENETHLNNELPYIYSSAEGMNHYGLPSKIKYAFWFDVLEVDTSYNHVMANFKLEPNAKGLIELRKANIPVVFPAITTHINTDYRFFYFSGDFCDNPIGLGTAYFKQIHHLSWFMYNKRDPQERKSFFWTFYRPLVTTILNDYYSSIHL